MEQSSQSFCNMKNLILILSILSTSLAFAGFFGSDEPVPEAQNFMKDSKYVMYGCTPLSGSMKAENVRHLQDYSMLTMAQSEEEAKVKTFDKLHLAVGVKGSFDKTKVLRFKGTGSVFKDIVCARIQDLEFK